jgi:hypothetical protein
MEAARQDADGPAGDIVYRQYANARAAAEAES